MINVAKEVYDYECSECSERGVNFYKIKNESTTACHTFCFFIILYASISRYEYARQLFLYVIESYSVHTLFDKNVM